MERLDEYTRLRSEGDGVPNFLVPRGWPDKGSVEFQQVSVAFEGGAGLRNISLHIEGGTRVGLCGRSGAGKTTLLNAIFRIILPTTGRILIDGVATSTVSLRQLRSTLCIVPQHPFLFKGTVRFNLDPFDRHSDEKLWEALDKAHMRNVIAALPGGLQASIEERGSNFSAGQRQLIALARAILIGAKIVVRISSLGCFCLTCF